LCGLVGAVTGGGEGREGSGSLSDSRSFLSSACDFGGFMESKMAESGGEGRLELLGSIFGELNWAERNGEEVDE